MHYSIDQRLHLFARDVALNARWILGDCPLALRAAMATKMVLDYELMIERFSSCFSERRMEILREKFYNELRLPRDFLFH